MRTHSVGADGMLLNYLLSAFKDKNRTTIKQLLRFGAVTVNGRVVTRHDFALKKGDEIRFRPKPAASSASGEKPLLKTRFPVLYEDDAIVVIDKPSGLLTVATEKEKFKTAYYELTDYVRSTSAEGEGRVFIVHRLDRDASGVLVFAKTEAAKLFLQKHWDQTEKKYYAVVEGTPREKTGRIESFLTEDKFRRVFSTKESSHSKYAATDYRVVSSDGKYSLVEVSLMTGRKNQIRVHLADLGHPIAGDEKYGAAADPAGRLCLHACSLALPHPDTGVMQTFTCDLPEPLKKIFPDLRTKLKPRDPKHDHPNKK